MTILVTKSRFHVYYRCITRVKKFVYSAAADGGAGVYSTRAGRDFLSRVDSRALCHCLSDGLHAAH